MWRGGEGWKGEGRGGEGWKGVERGGEGGEGWSEANRGWRWWVKAGGQEAHHLALRCPDPNPTPNHGQKHTNSFCAAEVSWNSSTSTCSYLGVAVSSRYMLVPRQVAGIR